MKVLILGVIATFSILAQELDEIHLPDEDEEECSTYILADDEGDVDDRLIYAFPANQNIAFIKRP